MAKEEASVADTTAQKTTNRIDTLKKLMKTDALICAGDNIMLNIGNNDKGQVQYMPVLRFMRKVPTDAQMEAKEPGTVFVATPEGIELFEAGAFYDYALEEAKTRFLKQFDRMLEDKLELVK